jgi:FtsH-binding integral membrane protein
MTTIQPHDPSEESASSGAVRVLLGAAAWSLLAAVAAVVVCLLVDGGEAAVGAATGGLATLAILAIGTWIVLKVSEVSPVASLLTALGVFTAQGILLLVTLAVLAQLTSGPQVTAGAIAVIAVTVVWTTMFALLVRREEIPLFDLSAVDGPGAA